MRHNPITDPRHPQYPNREIKIDLNEKLPCGHTIRTHKGWVDIRIREVFEGRVDGYDHFKAILRKIGLFTAQIDIEFDYMTFFTPEPNKMNALGLFVNFFMTNHVRDSQDALIEGFTKIAEKRMLRFHAKPSYENAIPILTIVSEIEMSLQWWFKFFRMDLFMVVNRILALYRQRLISDGNLRVNVTDHGYRRNFSIG